MPKRKMKIGIIVWRDAAYFFTKKLPKRLPLPQMTAGFVIEANDKFANIGTNVGYDEKTGKVTPIDGFIIPRGAAIKVKVMRITDDFEDA